MHSIRPSLVVIAALLAFTGAALAAALPRSVSSSRQFIVYGSDPHLRGGVCDLGERIKGHVLSVLQERDEWKTPLVVFAQRRPANLPDAPVAQLNISQTGFGLKLQLDLMFGSDGDAAEIEREMLRMILLERMYRATPETPAGTRYVQPPDWLLDGLLAVAPEHDVTKFAEHLAPFVAENRITPLEEFLRQQPALLESPSRALYRAYSAALISMLLERPDGRALLARFIAEIPGQSEDSFAALKKHFPALGANDVDIQQTWVRAVAAIINREQFRMLGCEETERALAKVLQVKMGRKEGEVYTLEEFPRFVRLSGAPEALRDVQRQLLLLSGRANPLHAAIIGEYQQITALLARKKIHRIQERLARLRGDREGISRRMNAVNDYLNWYEATQTRSPSGAFAEYMKAAALAAEHEPRRRDPISVYLDAMQAQLQD